MLLQQLSDQLPPELHGELRAWRACFRAPEDPAACTVVIGEALAAHHGFPLDPDTAELWRAVRWRVHRCNHVIHAISLSPCRQSRQTATQALACNLLRYALNPRDLCKRPLLNDPCTYHRPLVLR